MEAILACHPARSTEWLDCHPKSCELWRIHTGPIMRTFKVALILLSMSAPHQWDQTNTIYVISTACFTGAWRRWYDPYVKQDLAAHQVATKNVSRPRARPYWAVEATGRPSHVEESCQAWLSHLPESTAEPVFSITSLRPLASSKKGSSKTSWRWHWCSSSTELQQPWAAVKWQSLAVMAAHQLYPISNLKAVVPPAQTRRIILRDTPVSMGIR